MQIDPTLISVSAIAAGDYDRYLRTFANSVRAFRYPVVIGFGHEMNAYWYSWGYGHTSPATFVAAWRHIVTLFRGQGADNVVWLWTLQADEPGTGPITSWWPGARYVTWIGIDGYYYRPYETFASIFGKTIAQVRAFTGQPVLLSRPPWVRLLVRRKRSQTCSPGCSCTACWGLCGSTSPRMTGSTTRTGTSKTARPPKWLSGAAPPD